MIDVTIGAGVTATPYPAGTHGDEHRLNPAGAQLFMGASVYTETDDREWLVTELHPGNVYTVRPLENVQRELAESTHSIPLSATIPRESGASLDEILEHARAFLEAPAAAVIRPIGESVVVEAPESSFDRPWTSASTLETPPRDGIAHPATLTEETPMNDIRTARAGQRLPDAELVESGIVEADPFARPFRDAAVDVDTFSAAQENANRIASWPPDRIMDWVDELTVSEARYVLEQVEEIANEHSNRAGSLRNVGEIVRERISLAARHGLDTPTMGASAGRKASGS